MPTGGIGGGEVIEPYWKSHDGRHVLYHGDCLDILPTLGKVDAVVIDFMMR